MGNCASITKKGTPCKNPSVVGQQYCRVHLGTIKSSVIDSGSNESPGSSTKFSPQEVHQFLKDEYLHIQKTIVDLDGRAVSIKAWTVSFSLAAMVGAFIKSSPAIFLVSAGSALVFLSIEVIWKEIQTAFYSRSSQIEDYFAGKSSDITPFQVDRYWVSSYKSRGFKEYFRTLFRVHVMLPHLPIMIAALALYGLSITGTINLEPNNKIQPTSCVGG